MEIITLYHQSDFTTPILAPRDEVYAKRNTQYGEHYIAVVDAFIFDTSGRLIMQKRSMKKKVSPWLLHTSVGGHVNPGEPIDFTLAHECVEEFGYPPLILPDEISWDIGLKKLESYLGKFVLMKKLCNWQLEFTHVDSNGTHNAFDLCHDFIWIFSWAPENLDHSADGFFPLKLEEIDKIIDCDSEKITRSFQAHYQLHRDYFYEFRDMLRLKLNE